MAQWDKILRRVLDGQADNNIGFSDMCGLLERLGFKQRIRGDHFVFTKPGVVEAINLQPESGKVKAYQVRQVRGILQTYGLTRVP